VEVRAYFYLYYLRVSNFKLLRPSSISRFPCHAVFILQDSMSTQVLNIVQLLLEAGRGGRGEEHPGGIVTASPRCSGDGGDVTAGYAAPSRVAPL
jgi:hypothetical protein